jgi:endoglucanase
LIRYGGLRLLMPGEWARPSRFNPEVVVNLSYYIPFAMPLLEGVDPRGPWTELRADGRRLLEGLIHPPSDWSEVNAHGEARPATGWPKTFGYDAVRVPLYLLQVGESPATLFRFLTATWGEPEPHRDPYRFDVMSFRNLGHFHGRPYDILHELVLCAETGQPVADLTFDPRMDNYFAASLYMLTMASMYAHYQECFG